METDVQEREGLFSGSMSGVSRLIVVENEKKKEDEEPDYYAFIVPNRRVGQGAEHVDGL